MARIREEVNDLALARFHVMGAVSEKAKRLDLKHRIALTSHFRLNKLHE
jgi:hypothetical protein